MKIASINIKEYNRRMAVPLRLTGGVLSERRGAIIQVKTENGLAGLGEATPLMGFSPDSLETTIKTLDAINNLLHGKEIPHSLDQVNDMVRQIIPDGYPAAVFGLETALCDLAAQAAEQPLSSWLTPKPLMKVSVNYLIAGRDNNWTGIKLDIKGGGYRTVKIKLGGGSPEDDIALVRNVFSLLDNDITIRLDANRRWSFDDAVRVLNGLRGCNIEYVEEPLSVADPAALARLKEKTGVRIALDETLAEVDDIEALLTSGAVDVMIVKPTVLGGIARAIDMAGMAHRHGRQIVITSTFESEIGLAALVHLAAAVCAEGTACGLNTISIFAENHASEFLRVENGAIRVPNGPGLGLPADLWEAA